MNRLKVVGAEVLIAAALITIFSILHNKTGKGVTVLSSGIRQINTAGIIAKFSDIKYSIPKSEPTDRWQAVNMRVTAYCPCEKCCGPSAKGVTASGHKIAPGETFVAAGKQFPFGTELIIPGYNDNKPVKVLDRGGAIRGNHIDIFFPSHEQAVAWGVKTLDVQIRSE